MCKTYGIQTYGIDFRGANSKYKGIMVSHKKGNTKTDALIAIICI